MTAPVVVVGSANLDVVVAADRRPGPGETVFGRAYSESAGGKGANQAVAVAREAPCVFIGMLGEDPAAELIDEQLRSRGVDTSRLRRTSGATGRAFITVTADKENSITVVPLSNAKLDAADVAHDLNAIGPAVVLTQCEISLDVVMTIAELAEHAGIRFILNPSPITDLPRELISLADPLIVNKGEALAILGLEETAAPAAQELATALSAYARSVTLTDGARGAYVARRGTTSHIPGAMVTVVDTTGAGDEFAGVLAGRLAQGDTLTQAATAANRAAARIVTLPRRAR